MITNIDELTQNEAVAYFRVDLCLSDPDNYSLDEKREICEEMVVTSGAIEEAMRKDSNELPPHGQNVMLGLLKSCRARRPPPWKSVDKGTKASQTRASGGGMPSIRVECRAEAQL